MKKNCDCYRTTERVCYTPFYTQAYFKTVGICNGTKERDECSCGGDEAKCDFYPKIRARAIQKQKEDNCLIVTYDCCPPDVPTLCIAKKDGDKVKVLNTIQGDVAFRMYEYLKGNAYLMDEKIIRCRDCNVPHNKWTGCPKLNGLVTPPDFYCALAEPKEKDN